jgi:hypothetical protein
MDSTSSIVVVFCHQGRFDSAHHCNSSYCSPVAVTGAYVMNECTCLLREQVELLLRSYTVLMYTDVKLLPCWCVPMFGQGTRQHVSWKI